MSSFFEAMLGGSGARPSAPIPNQIQCALAFTQMMRATACRHIEHDNEFAAATTVCKSAPESGAYTAAMECLRTYFNGENDFNGLPTSRPSSDDDAAPGLGARNNPPAPSGAPNETKTEMPAREAARV